MAKHVEHFTRNPLISQSICIYFPTLILDLVGFYYPLEVSRGKYWGLGVFLLQYFPLVKI